MSGDSWFRSTPFSITADAESSKFWAGRPNIRRRLDRILASLQKRPDSTFDVIWANLGAGKSHTLYYLASRIADQNADAVCVVTEVPNQFRNFLDLYKRIMAKMPIPRVAKGIISGNGSIGRDDLSKAMRIIIHGHGVEKETALQWLLGERPLLKTLRDFTGISSRIEDDATAGDVLSALVSSMEAAGMRFCLMLDEFQRVGGMSERIRSQVNSTLRTIISANPRGFSLFVAISSRMEKTAMAILPEELKSIIGMRPTISLPEMEVNEAFQFIEERFAFFRPGGYDGDSLAPFGKEVVVETLERIAKADSVKMIPRSILQSLGYLFDGIAGEGTVSLSLEEAREMLDELNWGAVEFGGE